MNLKISSFCTQKIQVHKEICCNLKMITRQLENAERISWLQRYIFLPGYLKSFFSFLSFTYLPHCFAPKIMAAKIWCCSADPPRIRANDGSKESSDRELSNEPSFARFRWGSAPSHQIVEATILDWCFCINPFWQPRSHPCSDSSERRLKRKLWSRAFQWAIVRTIPMRISAAASNRSSHEFTKRFWELFGGDQQERKKN